MCVNTCAITVFILNVFLLTHVRTNETNDTQTCAQLYEKGVEAYLENRWEDCVVNFEKALEKYRKYRKKVQDCRLKCKSDAEYSEPLYPVDIENLLFFERAIRQTLCIIECQNGSPEILENHNVNLESINLFEEQRPYEYLHICYFQTKQLEKAASAAFTFLVAHPDNTVMASNLKQYLNHNIEKKDIVNYEAKDYVYLYAHGADAYDKKDWQFVVYNMEESLIHYLQAEEECRAQCEGPFDHGWYPDFIPSISNHFTVSLKCKQKCRKKLSSLNGEIHDDLLPSHYHYLQYAYYKLGNLKAACQAVASYLLFYPDDETMLDNMRYYSKQPKIEITYFQPRREATQYMQRQIYETRLLKFVHNEFRNKLVTSTEHINLKSGVTMSEIYLKGAKRVVIDGITTGVECKSLMEIAKYYAVIGDGYEGKSPHTSLEIFEGITFNRVLFLSYYKMLNPKHLHIFFEVTEKVKELVKVHFKVKKELYFSYTQLVCRSARPDSPRNRIDFSHKIHADNCIIMENMTCFRTDPAFTWRDYSAILYLNDDFKGGDFVFSADAVGNRLQSKIHPKCGRMVAFSSGPENLHGVKAVKKGTRCAIGVWFTLNPDYGEKYRDLAKHVLDNNSQFEMDLLVNLDYPNPYVPVS